MSRSGIAQLTVQRESAASGMAKAEVIHCTGCCVQRPEIPKMTNFPIDLFFSSMAIPAALGLVGTLWALWAVIGPKQR